MYAIKNKITGDYAAKKSFWVFRPCTGDLTPILYTRRYDAEKKRRNLANNAEYSVHRGWLKAGDVLEVVEVALIERSEVKALPDDIPTDWVQLSLYP